MILSRHRDGGRLHFPIRPNHLLDGPEGPRAELSGHFVSSIDVCVDHRCETHALSFLL
jgi:hypothetical protein